MTDDVFSQTTGNEEQPEVISQETKSYLEELVGEGKKFKSPEDLAKSKIEADKHLKQLEGELAALRQQMAEKDVEADKSATAATLIEAIKQASSSKEGEDQQLPKEQLEQMVRSIIDTKSSEETKRTNYREANQFVLDKFKGDVEAARTYTAERAKQLGMDVNTLKALGEESPAAFKRLMESSQSTGSQGVTGLHETHVDNRSAGGQQMIDGHRTRAYYNALKKEIGAGKFWTDHKIQGEMYKDQMALGDRFNK